MTCKSKSSTKELAHLVETDSTLTLKGLVLPLWLSWLGWDSSDEFWGCERTLAKVRRAVEVKW